MKRILIHIPVEAYGEYDIFSQHDDRAFVNAVKTKYSGACPNVGNRLWFQGIVSAIQCSENRLDYWDPTMSKDYINQSYDLIVAPMANVFAEYFIPLLETLAERFRGIKIPVYVIACGIQAASYEKLDELCRRLKEPASKFISSVYDTGGEFALRGYFTKEFFDRLGFPTAVVTGCPSLYQLGRDLKISGEKVARDSFLPILNGAPRNFGKYMADHPNAVFIDQELFWQEKLDPSYFAQDLSDRRYLRMLLKKYGYAQTKYLLEDRVKLFPDMNAWREFIRNNHFSCSYGSKIHGSIMPILAGIPAILECRDARTREMADFFNIPFVFPEDAPQSLYELYMDVDYSGFNRDFAKHFDFYEDFLRKCGIVDKVNGDNPFFHGLDPAPEAWGGHEREERLLKALVDKRYYWNSYCGLLNAKRKLASVIRR